MTGGASLMQTGAVIGMGYLRADVGLMMHTHGGCCRSLGVRDRLRRLGWLGLWLIARQSMYCWLTPPGDASNGDAVDVGRTAESSSTRVQRGAHR